MVVDTSAALAVLLQEDEAGEFTAAIEAVETALISVASVIEAGIVLCHRGGTETRADLENFVVEGGLHVEPVTVRHISIALDAYDRFGKGRGHPARLDFGDCFSYALAQERGLPLLFKGDDFARTDVTPAVRT